MTPVLALRSLGIGAATGMRSMAGPTAASPATAWGRLMPFLALGEAIVDKLPIAPPRTMPAALLVRAIAGGFAGGAVAKAGGGSRAIGIALGVAGAVGMSYAGLAYRKAASRSIPPVVAALIEDGIAYGLARVAAKRS